MPFLNDWRIQAEHSLKPFARLYQQAQKVNVKYGLFSAALIWPVRHPVQGFESEAIEAVKQVAGVHSRHIMKVVQNWSDDPLAAVLDLNERARGNQELRAGLDALIYHFDLFPAFTKEIASAIVEEKGDGDATEISEAILAIMVKGKDGRKAMDREGGLEVTGDIQGEMVNIAENLSIESVVFNFIKQETPAQIDDEKINWGDKRVLLRDRVKSFWLEDEGVLGRSLRDNQPMTILVAPQPEAVPNPWEGTISAPYENAIDPHDKMLEIFSESQNALLILGEPGSGKTIKLLELAKEALALSEKDIRYSIPVVFFLSSWDDDRLSIADWLVAQLREKYSIPETVGRPWIMNDKLILLLDGLDEVAADLRNACVDALNTFREQHGSAGIALTCRYRVYFQLENRLKFGGAIVLQPLTVDQVQEHLSSMGPKFEPLRDAVCQDQRLMEWAKSPLVLGQMIESYLLAPVETIDLRNSHSTEEYYRKLVKLNIDRQFQRETRLEYPAYQKKKMLDWLSWLAQNLRVHDSSQFLIEGLQPYWLSYRTHIWLYSMITRLVGGLIIGIALGLIESKFLLFNSESFWIGPTVGLILGSLMGLLNARLLLRSHESRKRKTDSGSNKSAGPPKKPGTSLLIVALIVLGIPLICVLAGMGIISLGPLPSVIFDFMIGVPAAVMILGSKRKDQKEASEILVMDMLDWSWPKAVSGLFTGGFYTLLVAFLVGLLVILPLVGLMFVFFWAQTQPNTTGPNIIPAESCSSLQELPDLFKSCLIFFTWFADLPSWFSEQPTGVIVRLLLSAVIVPLIEMFLVPISLIGLVVGGLVGGLSGKQIAKNIKPNQGIRQTIRSALIASLALFGGSWLALWFTELIRSLTLIPLISALAPREFILHFPTDSTKFITSMLGNELQLSLIPHFSTSWTPIVLGIAIFGGIAFGGFTVIQHYTLRLIFYRAKWIPWRLDRFLDDAVERNILERTGGTYMFRHPSYLDYFASLGKLRASAPT